MERELKPCPFCGADGGILRIETGSFGKNPVKWTASILCTRCLASILRGKIEDTEEAAKQTVIDKWNLRKI